MSKKKGLPRRAPITVDAYELRAVLNMAEFGFNKCVSVSREKFTREAIKNLAKLVGLRVSPELGKWVLPND
jgi:hypothetical protein